MQMVKIQIPDREQCARGFVALARRGGVDCYRDNVFIIPEPGLELLREMEISYIELDRGGFDFALKAMRDALTAQER